MFVLDKLVVPAGAVRAHVWLNHIPEDRAVDRFSADHPRVIDADQNDTVAVKVLLGDVRHSVGHAQDRSGDGYGGPLSSRLVGEGQCPLELEPVDLGQVTQGGRILDEGEPSGGPGRQSREVSFHASILHHWSDSFGVLRVEETLELAASALRRGRVVLGAWCRSEIMTSGYCSLASPRRLAIQARAGSKSG